MHAPCAAIACRPAVCRPAPRLALYAVLSARQSASAFNQPLTFDTSVVTNMRAMFLVRSARALSPVCSRALSFTHMQLAPPSPTAYHPLARISPRIVCPPFESRQGARAFNQPLTLDTSSVTDMSWMFYVHSSHAAPTIM